MADFKKCFDRVIELEGGYKLTHVPGDHGGTTYAGISKVKWPQWEGWSKPNPQLYVADFYRKNFWGAVQGDNIKSDRIALLMFDFAVNAGVFVATKLAQQLVGVGIDGEMGPNTLAALNEYDDRLFSLAYTLLKIYRYNDIAGKGENIKFLRGWVNRCRLLN